MNSVNSPANLDFEKNVVKNKFILFCANINSINNTIFFNNKPDPPDAAKK